MALANYTDLQASIASWLQRDDLTAQIPDFINLAESYINNDLRLRSMIAEASIVPSTVNDYVDLPAGFIEAISFIDDSDEELLEVHHDILQTLTTDTGSPAYYSVTSRINFDCKASGALSYTMTYYKGLDLATDTTNDVLTNHPSIYLYGSLLQASVYMKNDKRLGTWLELYNKAVNAANSRSQDTLVKLRSDHPSVARHYDITKDY